MTLQQRQWWLPPPRHDQDQEPRFGTSVLALGPNPGSQMEVTGRAPSAWACLSHNDVHLGL